MILNAVETLARLPDLIHLFYLIVGLTDCFAASLRFQSELILPYSEGF